MPRFSKIIDILLWRSFQAILVVLLGLSSAAYLNADVVQNVAQFLAQNVRFQNFGSVDYTVGLPVNTTRLVVGGNNSPGSVSAGSYLELDGNSSPYTGNLLCGTGSTAGSFIGFDFGSSTSYLRLRDNALSEIWRFTNAGNALAAVSGAGLVSNTSDGSDTKQVCLGGGGAATVDGSRGAFICLNGEQNSSGRLYLGSSGGSGVVTLDTPNFYVRNADTTIKWQFDSSGNLSGDASAGGNVIIARSGKTYYLDSDTAASRCKGTSTLNGTTAVTVSTTCAATSMMVNIARTSAGTAGNVYFENVVNGTSFDLKSSTVGDTGTVSWWILKEG